MDNILNPGVGGHSEDTEGEPSGFPSFPSGEHFPGRLSGLPTRVAHFSSSKKLVGLVDTGSSLT